MTHPTTLNLDFPPSLYYCTGGVQVENDARSITTVRLAANVEHLAAKQTDMDQDQDRGQIRHNIDVRTYWIS